MLDKEKVEISYSDGTTYEGHVNEQLEKQGSGITVYTKECREGDMYGVYKVYKGSFKHDKELRES
ncbi:MAG: hypothetical protein LBG13_00420 [Holosporales bacterium]|jgi:hypothetical protein|nr:hypothetical protein [Holosporales bacterium]